MTYAWDAAFGSVSRVAQAVKAVCRAMPDWYRIEQGLTEVRIYVERSFIWPAPDKKVLYVGWDGWFQTWPLYDLRAALKEVEP